MANKKAAGAFRRPLALVLLVGWGSPSPTSRGCHWPLGRTVGVRGRLDGGGAHRTVSRGAGVVHGRVSAVPHGGDPALPKPGRAGTEGARGLFGVPEHRLQPGSPRRPVVPEIPRPCNPNMA